MFEKSYSRCVLNLFVLFLIISGNCAQILSLPEATSTAKSSSEANIDLCVELSPRFLSSRNGDYQTLTCRAQLCGTDIADNSGADGSPPVATFSQPVFDWDSQLGHIVTLNGTRCDDNRQTCWQSINLDLRYFAVQLNRIGKDSMRFSCSVSDTLDTQVGLDDTQVTQTAFNRFKVFPGLRVNDLCNYDNECGANMQCMQSTTNPSTTVCQCGSDLITGVQYVPIIDENYGEIICLPSVLLNDSCLYDQQCQANDGNSVCAPQPDGEPNVCDCIAGTQYVGNGCQEASESTTTAGSPSIVWWIFTSNSGDPKNDYSSSNFHMSLRTAAYIMIMLAIIVPVVLIVVALIVVCYRITFRDDEQKNSLKVMFPTPKLRIDDLYEKKQKADDKYDLVKNDQLSNNYA